MSKIQDILDLGAKGYYLGRLAYGQDVFNAVYNLVTVSQHIKLHAVPGDKYSREKLENTKNKLMEFREAANIQVKTRVDSGGKKHGNGGGIHHQGLCEGSPCMRVMKRMSTATKSPMALLRTCQAAGSANGWMQKAESD